MNLISSVSVSLSLALMAASLFPASLAGADQNNDVSRNEDVQVLSAKRHSSGIMFRDGQNFTGPFRAVEVRKCEILDTTWEEIEKAPAQTQVRFDCTKALGEATGFPSVRRLLSKANRTPADREGYYGKVYFYENEAIYHVVTVEMAVKESVLAAKEFEQIGFYLNMSWYAYYQSPPAPGNGNGDPQVISAADVRAQASESRQVTLKNGDTARVIRVQVPVSPGLGGSSYIQGIYLRPYVSYVDGAGKRYLRYDSVEKDYFFNYQIEFDRSGDVLRKAQ